jgi:hypothetical protein
MWKAAGYAGKKKQGTADRRGQSHEGKKKDGAQMGQWETLVPKKNYWRTGRRVMNTLYILTESCRQQFTVLGHTEQYSVNAKQQNSKTVLMY